MLSIQPEGTFLLLDYFGTGGQATVENRIKIYRDVNDLTTAVQWCPAYPLAEANTRADLRILFFSIGATLAYRAVWRDLSFEPGKHSYCVDCDRGARREMDEFFGRSPGSDQFGYAEVRARLLFPFNDYVVMDVNGALRYEGRHDRSFDWFYTSIYDRGVLGRFEVDMFFKDRDWGGIGPYLQLLVLPRDGQHDGAMGVRLQRRDATRPALAQRPAVPHLPDPAGRRDVRPAQLLRADPLAADLSMPSSSDLANPRRHRLLASRSRRTPVEMRRAANQLHCRMTRVLLLGAGNIGAAITELLVETGDFDVCVGDRDPQALAALGERTRRRAWSTCTTSASIRDALAGRDVVINALPYYLNLPIARAARAERVHYFDLTEDVATAREIRKLAEDARQRVRAAVRPRARLHLDRRRATGQPLREAAPRAHARRRAAAVSRQRAQVQPDLEHGRADQRVLQRRAR